MRDDPQPLAKAAAAPAEMLWLLGQPHLSDYFEFVRDQVVGGTRMCRRALTDEWRAANDLYYDLEQEEAGLADTIHTKPLPQKLRPLADALTEQPFFRNTFNALPASFEMVELDKLIVSQPHITCSFSEDRARSLGPSPSPATLFHYCQPIAHDAPEVCIEQTEEDRIVLSSASTDLRPQRLRLLRGVEAEPTATGAIAAMVGMPVGFGSNFFVAIRSENRLVLHNGYHRAHSMRAAGIKHAPCLVQTVTRKDELRIAASDKVSSDPEFFFRSKRPPLLKDFFDPRLARRFQLRPQRTVVEVEISVRRFRQIEADPL